MFANQSMDLSEAFREWLLKQLRALRRSAEDVPHLGEKGPLCMLANSGT